MTEQPTALRLADAMSLSFPGNLGIDKAAAELRRLHQQELANIEWQEKTAWVQKTAKPDELGMHRADVMSRRLGRLKNQRDALMEALERIAQLSMSQFHIPYDMAAEACNIASAAIKQAEGEKT